MHSRYYCYLLSERTQLNAKDIFAGQNCEFRSIKKRQQIHLFQSLGIVCYKPFRTKSRDNFYFLRLTTFSRIKISFHFRQIETHLSLMDCSRIEHKEHEWFISLFRQLLLLCFLSWNLKCLLGHTRVVFKK